MAVLKNPAYELLLVRALAIAILICLSFASCSKTAGKQVDTATNRPVSVRVLPVEQRQIRRNVEAVGSLFPLEEVTVSSEVEIELETCTSETGTPQ
jgi:hypothetical protein